MTDVAQAFYDETVILETQHFLEAYSLGDAPMITIEFESILYRVKNTLST
jgi:hypothetical protein